MTLSDDLDDVDESPVVTSSSSSPHYGPTSASAGVAFAAAVASNDIEEDWLAPLKQDLENAKMRLAAHIKFCRDNRVSCNPEETPEMRRKLEKLQSRANAVNCRPEIRHHLIKSCDRLRYSMEMNRTLQTLHREYESLQMLLEAEEEHDDEGIPEDQDPVEYVESLYASHAANKRQKREFKKTTEKDRVRQLELDNEFFRQQHQQQPRGA
jgi:hypothetical protein